MWINNFFILFMIIIEHLEIYRMLFYFILFECSEVKLRTFVF